MPKFSIIIPVYNGAACLPTCLESVLGQTVGDYELLLVDDGSTDGSGGICDAFARTHANVRVFHKENGGAASARNAGLANARGDYLLFWDDDDTLAPDTLARCDQALAQSRADLVIFGMAFDHYEKNALVRTETLSCGHGGIYDKKQLLSEFRAFFDDNALSSACNKVFRRSLVGELRFDGEMTLYEDLEFVLRYLRRCDTLSLLPVPLYHYRLAEKETHLAGRVADPARLSAQLEKVSLAALALHREGPAPACLDTAAALYLQCLGFHLAFFPHTEAELAALLPACLGKPHFRALLAEGARLRPEDTAFLRAVEEGQFRAIRRRQVQKRLRRRVRRCIKNLLRPLGLC